LKRFAVAAFLFTLPWICFAQVSIPHGTVSYHVYKTAVGKNLPGDQEEFYVYTPPSYDPKSSTKYPVLYLLHGWRENAAVWTKSGDANLFLDKQIASGKVRPMIVVMPAGYGNFSFAKALPIVWDEPAKIQENVDLFSRMLLAEIMPQVESAFKISTKREDRAIAGLSMGGLEAITIAFDNPKKFGWVAGFSSPVRHLQLERWSAMTPKTADFRLIWISWGLSDPYVIRGNKKLVAALGERGFDVSSSVIQGAHQWPVWRYNLSQFAPLLFQTK